MLPDLRLGAEVDAQLAEEEWDLWRSGEFEQAFFAAGAEEEVPEPKKGKKRRKRDRNPKWHRKQAFVQVKAWDQVLRARVGKGLEYFGEKAPFAAGAPPPALVLHMDEASSNMSAVSWMAYKAGLRVMCLSDPFHRCWNDCKLALLRSGQYWVVLLARVVFNLPYGPWEGCAWFEKLKSSAAGSLQLLPVDGPIWKAFYPLVASDRNKAVAGTRLHKEAVLREAATDSVSCKGPKMALNRWFGYVECIRPHLKDWNARLLWVLLVGMRLGLYRDHKEFPLWGGPAACKAVPVDDDECFAEREAAAEVVAEAGKDAGAEAAKPEPEHGPVGAGERYLKKIREASETLCSQLGRLCATSRCRACCGCITQCFTSCTLNTPAMLRRFEAQRSPAATTWLALAGSTRSACGRLSGSCEIRGSWLGWASLATAASGLLQLFCGSKQSGCRSRILWPNEWCSCCAA